MNRTFTDPYLRTFRMPLVMRLRGRIDELRDVIEAQTRYRVAQEKRVRELERELARSARELSKVKPCNCGEGVILDSADRS